MSFHSKLLLGTASANTKIGVKCPFYVCAWPIYALNMGTSGENVHLSQAQFVSRESNDPRVSMLETRCIEAITRVVCWPVPAAAFSIPFFNETSTKESRWAERINDGVTPQTQLN